MSPRAEFRAAACGLLVLLGGCDRKPKPLPAPMAAFAQAAPRLAKAQASAAAEPPWFNQASPQGAALNLAYTHDVGLQVAGGAIAAHFNAARDRCLGTPALRCVLLRADFGTVPTDADATPRHQGNLAVRLPHDQIAAYAASLTAPLPGETAGLATVIRQSMSAEDLGQPITDTNQRIAQLQSYLASLKSLGERLTIGVGDLVKIAGETARTQTEIEAAQAEQRNFAQRVSTEELDVSFEEPAPPPPMPRPVAEAVAGARETFASNVAAAITVGVGIIPWTPFALLALFGLWIVRILLFGRRRR